MSKFGARLKNACAIRGAIKLLPLTKFKFIVPSQTIHGLCKPFTPIVGTTGLWGTAVLSLLLVGTGSVHPRLVFSVVNWLKAVSLYEFAATFLTFVICVFVHEMGHAIACLKYTGMDGSVRVQFYRGLPVFTTDVSSLYLCGPIQKGIIALSGIALQTTFSLLLLLRPIHSIQMGASLSLLSAAFALVPLSGSDGYWFLSDVFKTKIVGPFGESGRRDWIGYAYAVWLTLITSFFVFVLLRDGIKLIASGSSSFYGDRLWGSSFIIIGIYVIALSFIFLSRTAEFLKSNEVALK